MEIKRSDWDRYISKLSAVDKKAAAMMEAYVQQVGFEHMDTLIRTGYLLTQRCSEAASALSAQFYDELAAASGKSLPPAEPAEPPTYGEVAKTINGIHKTSENPEEYAGAVGRMVKRTGADTMLQNAERDGAEFAWVPNGDTCAFCMALASRGWQKMSKKALKNGHAEHIHSNCDCTYAIRFDGSTTIEGYDPEEYKAKYDAAEGATPQERINYMRRQQYAEKKRAKAIDAPGAALLNKNGKNIEISPLVFDGDRYKEQKKVLINLIKDYNTRLVSVKPGMGGQGNRKILAGSVGVMTGENMTLGSRKMDTVVHEFAHTLASSLADKYGLTHDTDFWKEIKKARRRYMREVGQNTNLWISTYEHSSGDIDEYMAEGFAVAKMLELGYPPPDFKYSKGGYKYAKIVLGIIDKYFKK